MREDDVLGYAPLLDNKVWVKNTVEIQPTHIREQLQFRRKLCILEQEQLNSLRLTLLTNEGLIEGVTEGFNRIEQDYRLNIFSYHSPIIMKKNLSIIKIFLLAPTNQLIIGVDLRSKIILTKDDFYHANHYFYII